MATITLLDGDFGAAASVSVGEIEIFLPDAARPGMSQPIPLSEIAEVEAIADESGQVNEAAPSVTRGFLPFGTRKVKEVKFRVRLRDGRGFTASADAVVFAALRTARVSGTLSAGEALEAEARADQLIAKYLREKQAVAPTPATGTAQAEAPAVMPAQMADDPSLAPPPGERAVFGRRRRV